ncbi:sulfatase-like hydrolase/transferase, partial [Lysinibacillus sp. GbtcB16]|uniref:sulfatase-like hydrolase/transferase n=1 Tax=Lysinibacillus sp. GbtcB16 TaxID=2824761 RepID=UPI002811AA0E
MADDHRDEAIGAFGNPIVQTPVLDELANRAVAYRNMHIFGGLTGAVCAPSRACVNTGMSIFHAMIGKDPSVWEHSTTIRADVQLLPQVMRAS